MEGAEGGFLLQAWRGREFRLKEGGGGCDVSMRSVCVPLADLVMLAIQRQHLSKQHVLLCERESSSASKEL